MLTELVQAKITERQRSRLVELREVTGLSQAEIIRRLIENSKVISMPMPAAEISSRATVDSGPA